VEAESGEMRELKCSDYLKHLSPSLSPRASVGGVVRWTASGESMSRQRPAAIQVVDDDDVDV